MASTDLLFELPPLDGSPVNLLFGETADPPEDPDAHVSGHIALPLSLVVGGQVHPAVRAAGTISITVVLQVGGEVEYDTNTNRPLVNKTATSYQDGAASPQQVGTGFQDGEDYFGGFANRYQDATALPTDLSEQYQDANHVWQRIVGRYQEADGLQASTAGHYQDAMRVWRGIVGRYQNADRLHNGAKQRYQDTDRGVRKSTAGRFQDARRHSMPYWSGNRLGAPRWARAGRTRYQDAMSPPPGIWIKPGPPEPGDACYSPNPHLLFEHPWIAGDTNLLFICDKHDPGPEPEPGVVVPVKKVYLVVNSAILIRVSDGKVIPTSAMSMSLDVDSWTWSFSASTPVSAYADVAWQAGEPVEVQATVNGTDFRFLVENIGRDRTFVKDALRISGRGRSALLDTPYSPVLTLFEENGLTSQQLAEWVLTDNGISLGWDVDWNITPWFVPGGVFSHQGSYMGGVTRIAESAGAYIQPHNTADTIHVLARYPSAPWEWASVSPDFELPSAVVQTEGTEWVRKPYYNRVYVRGESVGVNGRVTRNGSAGDMLAQEVVDPLITHVDAARQRGIAILSDVGRITNINLRLPVLSETGVIKPGKFVRYKDNGVNRIGITRSVQVDVRLPAIWQTIGIEHHEEPV